MSALRVRVPASSANLGPGFDALGMALSLHLEMGIDDGSALQEFAKIIDDSHPSLAAFRHAGGTGNVWVSLSFQWVADSVLVVPLEWLA